MVKIYQRPSGQYVVTVDKGLADAMGLAGAEAEWDVESRNALKLQIKNRGNDDD